MFQLQTLWDKFKDTVFTYYVFAISFIKYIVLVTLLFLADVRTIRKACPENIAEQSPWYHLLIAVVRHHDRKVYEFIWLRLSHPSHYGKKAGQDFRAGTEAEAMEESWLLAFAW